MDVQSITRRGVMLVLSSPSGTGKSTIARNLLSNEPNLTMSVSVTTRKRRGSEIDGTHYHFISEREFDRLKDSDALLEWAHVHGNYYGTPRDAVELALGDGRFCYRQFCGIAIDSGGTGEYDSFHADLFGCFKHVEGALQIDGF